MNRARIELIERARLKPTEALGELCMVYHNYLYVVARSALGSKLGLRVEPSDVVQEVLVEVVRQFARFPGTTGTEFARWLRGWLDKRSRTWAVPSQHQAGRGQNADLARCRVSDRDASRENPA